MSSVLTRIETFLMTFCPSARPLLLALSGGSDSLCLFYALLFLRDRYGRSFHVAHVDHRWRPESQKEAEVLRQLALQHQVPFHLKVLDPSRLKGNLEAACREERYTFFGELFGQLSFEGVLTGHHQDDQAETIFKRLLEGTHWSRWKGLQPESWVKGTRILRPLLKMTKKEIQQTLLEKNIQAFEDPSNRDLQFLRARLRETLFPRLNQEFGKQVQPSLIAIGQEAQELTDYFEARLAPLFDHLIQGPWGISLDLQSVLPTSLLEIKYLLRLLCQRQNFFLSREIIQRAAQALLSNEAHQLFEMGRQRLWIDRQRIFLVTSPWMAKGSPAIKIFPGHYTLGNWTLNISEDIYFSHHSISSWKEGWRGELKGYLPIGRSYTIGFKNSLDEKIVNQSAIKKRWNQAKVPAFLYDVFPLVWEGGGICHEFLTGKPLIPLKEGSSCLKIELIKNLTRDQKIFCFE